MVIITDANGNIQAPTIPENVYQGSNFANSITFLSPLPQSNECVIAFRKPNGVLTEPVRMTPYTSVPSQYDLNAWVCELDETITELYGQVTFQIIVYSSGKKIASCQGSFPVLRGVPSILPPEPSNSIYEQILEALSVINADMENGWFESKGLLPYDENFEYSIGATLFDKATDTLYTSLQDENLGNPLSDEDWWGKTKIYNGGSQEIQDMIDASIAQHNTSLTAHEDLFNAKQDALTLTQLDAVNSGIDSTKVGQIATNTSDISAINEKIPAQASSSNQLADKKFVADNYVPISFASRLYLSKTGTDTADLVNTQPTPSATNTLVVTSTNTTFDWDTPTLTITRTLETAIQLNNTNSFAVDLYFDLSRNTELTFGAKIKVSTDNGTTWTYISSNQSFGEKAYNNGFNSEDIVVYTDLATNETYPIGTLVAIELFKKQEHNSTLTTTYYCGVEIDGANVYSFVEFNFANTRINTNQIEDGAVTYDKLGQDVKDMIADPLPSHTSADVNKVLTVDSNNDVVWEYPADEIVTFTKTNSSGTFTVTSDDWVKAMNNDKAILRVTDNTDYYVLYKVKYDATTVYFEGDGKIAEFIKNGATYSGTFGSAGIEYTSNKVTSISSLSTDTEYPSAKCVYDLVGDLDTILQNLNNGGGV